MRRFPVLLLAFAIPGAASAAEPATGAIDRAHGRVTRYVESVGDAVDDWLSGAPATNGVGAVEDDNGPPKPVLARRGSRVVVSQEAEFRESGEIDYRLRLRAALDLPRFRNRAQVFFSSFVEEDEVLPDLAQPAPASQPLSSGEDGETGVRYFIFEKQRARLSFSSGVSFRPEPEPRLRLRGSWVGHRGPWILRLSQALFWESQQGFGEKSQIELTRLFGEDVWARVGTSAIWSEESEGVDFGQLWGLFRQLPGGRRVGVKAGFAGHTEPEGEIDRYLARLSYRCPLGRPWLRLEIEPGADFPADRDYEFSPLIVAQVDLMFAAERETRQRKR